MKEIIFYKKENGKIPVKEFLNEKLDIDLRSKIIYKIQLLSFNLLGFNDVKYLRDKIYEIRIKDSSNIYRVFYFHYIGNQIVFLDAIVKKENKLKNSILNKVIEYKNDYIKRTG